VGREGSEQWQRLLLPRRPRGSFVPLLFNAEQGGWAMSFGESRWRCMSEMNQQKRDGEGCALLKQEGAC
jgi:hypothetical protein